MRSEKPSWARGGLQFVRCMLIFLASLTAFLAVIALFIPRGSGPHPPQMECMNRLRIVGALLHMHRRSNEGAWSETGARFLLQVAPRIDEGDLSVFLCGKDARYEHLDPYDDRGSFAQLYRNDWRTAPCSYRGPDEELLARLREDPYPEEAIIIACDMNGADGRAPQHKKGVVCLWSNTKVSFVRWEEMEGFRWCSAIVPVGSESPDPRFRHLVP